MEEKNCSKCKRLLPVQCFSIARGRKDGLCGQCKECQKAYYEANKDRILRNKNAHHVANRDSIIEYQRNRYPSVAEQRRKKGADYYRENREAVLRARKEYYEKNKEKIAIKRKEYYSNNKGMFIAAAQNRQRNIQLDYASLTSEEKEQVNYIYKRAMQLQVETGIEMHVDHIIPLSKGGKHHPSNLQILSACDNRAKKDQCGWQDKAWPEFDDDGEPTGSSRPLLPADG